MNIAQDRTRLFESFRAAAIPLPLAFFCVLAVAQTPAPKAVLATAVPTAAREQTPNAPASPSGSHSHVLFSRSEDTAKPNPEVVPGIDPPPQALDPAGARLAERERRAITFTAYDLDVRLFAHQGSLAVRARVKLRNDGDQPLSHLRLQLSSTLQWERVQIAGKSTAFKSAILPSDADHTGSVKEATIELPAPLAPKASLNVDAMYSGPAPLSLARLQAIGTPTDIAQRSDWDEVSDDAVALRGFGDVLWYPASALPVALGDGAKYFTEIGQQKLRQTGAAFQATVTEEFVGEAPNLAVINGQIQPLAVTAGPSDAYLGIVTCAVAKMTLGFQLPSLFVLRRTEIDGEDLQAYSSEANRAVAQNYMAAAGLAGPLIHKWLGGHPKTPLILVDLPTSEAASFETGPALFTSLSPAGSPETASSQPQDAQALAHTLIHALSHAYFHSQRVWLDEGVAHFLAGEWLSQTQGREAALQAAEAQRNALALAEPATPGEGQGQSLIAAFDTVYYRTKAAYVLGMLRDIAGEDALSTALRAYSPGEDTRPEYFEGLLEKASGKDLRWFFDSWVYRDPGLPDLSIARAFPAHAAEPGQYLVTVEINNDGYAETEVPVTVLSREASVAERVRVPAHGRITHRILVRGEPTAVEVNDGSVPEVQATFHRQAISISR